jgi:hypothetical protein
MIVNYNHETFTVQGTGLTSDKRSSLFVRIFNDEDKDEKFYNIGPSLSPPEEDTLDRLEVWLARDMHYKTFLPS